MLRRILGLCILSIASACSSSPPPSTALPPPEAGIQIPHQIDRDVEPRLINTNEISGLLERSFPDQLREGGFSGSVVLFVFVDARGQVTQVMPRNPSSHSEFNRAAENVARAIKFSPATVGEEPLGVWITQQIDFNTR